MDFQQASHAGRTGQLRSQCLSGSQGGSDKENTRSAQEVTKVAQVNTSSAGHNDLPGQGRDGANAWLAAAMSAGGALDC